MHDRVLLTGIGIHLQILEISVVIVDPLGEGADLLLGLEEVRRTLDDTGLNPPKVVIELPEEIG